jgi:hypothetical protein
MNCLSPWSAVAPPQAEGRHDPSVPHTTQRAARRGTDWGQIRGKPGALNSVFQISGLRAEIQLRLNGWGRFQRTHAASVQMTGGEDRRAAGFCGSCSILKRGHFGLLGVRKPEALKPFGTMARHQQYEAGTLHDENPPAQPGRQIDLAGKTCRCEGGAIEAFQDGPRARRRIRLLRKLAPLVGLYRARAVPLMEQPAHQGFA